MRGERVALSGSSVREISDLVAALEAAAADRESAQRNAEEAHRLPRALFDGTSDGVFVKDLAGRHVMINEQERETLRAGADRVTHTATH